MLNRFIEHYGAPAALIKIIGVSFLILGILIMIFPELLAWLVGIFLIFDGLVLLGLGAKTKHYQKRFHQNRDFFHENF